MVRYSLQCMHFAEMIFMNAAAFNIFDFIKMKHTIVEHNQPHNQKIEKLINNTKNIFNLHILKEKKYIHVPNGK